MALLRTRSTPPGGWTYLQVETQAKITAENEDALIDQVIAHRQYKGLPNSNRAETKNEIERQICVRLGHLDCAPEGDGDKWVPQDGSKPTIGMMEIISFGKAALEFISSGAELAPMEEVNRRAEICRRCVLNSPITGCNCSVFYKILDATLPASRKLEGLHVCGICHCSNAVKVNLTEAQVLASNEGRNLVWPTEVPCWQAEIAAKVRDKMPVAP